MAWDFFISHASEDKLAIAEPLANYLARAKFKVWYDDFALKLGDSLLSSIDRGLASSRYGITILSKNFFSKKWPRRELAGLLATESSQNRILPVWHNLTAASVSNYSPILADLKAVDSTRGLQAVSKAIVAASFPKRVKDLALLIDVDLELSEEAQEKAHGRFRTLLSSGAEIADLRAFLSVNHSLLLNFGGYNSVLIPAFVLPHNITCDFAVLRSHGITGPIELELVILGPLDRGAIGSTLINLANQLGPKNKAPRKPYNYYGGTLVSEFPSLTCMGEAIRKVAHSDNLHFVAHDWWIFKLLIITGRRKGSSPEQINLPTMPELEIELASYDRLLDDDRPTRRF